MVDLTRNLAWAAFCLLDRAALGDAESATRCEWFHEWAAWWANESSKPPSRTRDPLNQCVPWAAESASHLFRGFCIADVSCSQDPAWERERKSTWIASPDHTRSLYDGGRCRIGACSGLSPRRRSRSLASPVWTVIGATRRHVASENIAGRAWRIGLARNRTRKDV